MCEEIPLPIPCTAFTKRIRGFENADAKASAFSIRCVESVPYAEDDTEEVVSKVRCLAHMIFCSSKSTVNLCVFY